MRRVIAGVVWRLRDELLFACLLLAGHFVVAWSLPYTNTGSTLGIFIFAFLTSLAAERAERLWSWRFMGWFVGGLVLSVVLGGFFWGSLAPP